MTKTIPAGIECPFCISEGGDLLHQDALCRVVLLTGDEGGYFPGFCRVVWNRHVSEMSDLAVAEQRHFLDVVLATERAIRAVQRPDKMNLASLGNVVPHLHWHVIPRWNDDSHFPAPIWAVGQRAGTMRPVANKAALAAAISEALKARGVAQ